MAKDDLQQRLTKSEEERQKEQQVHFNPHMTNGLSHCYLLDDSTLILRDIRSDFEFLSHFLTNFL